MKNENKELFLNKTKCTRKEYDMFLNVHSKTFAIQEFSRMGLYMVFYIICFAFSIIYKEYKVLLILVVWMSIYMFFKFIIYKKRVEEQEKSDKLLKEYTNTYKFYKHYFETLTPEGKANTFYYRIYNVIETESNFYIYISQYYAFIISKDGFIDCDSTQFADFLRKKIGLKYKIKYMHDK